jgi:hypothetical protein
MFLVVYAVLIYQKEYAATTEKLNISKNQLFPA